jgi:putative membrane protein
MTDNRTKDDANRFIVHPNVETHFSWLRTRLSAERTLMSWVRTAVSLIGFGFTIVQFFERFGKMEGIAPAAQPNAPRYLGLMLIGAGVIGLLIAVWEYRGLLGYLWHEEYQSVAGVGDAPGHTPLLAITLVLLLVGIFAFFSVLLRFV